MRYSCGVTKLNAPRTPSRHRVLGGLATALVAACGSDAITLPANYNELTIKPVVIDAAKELGLVTPLGGVVGGPHPMIEGDANLFEPFQYAAVDFIRVPEGYLCGATLSGVFPNKTADASLVASYDFTALDAILNDTITYPGVQPAADARFGRTPLSYQALFDLGLDTCAVDGDGVQTGAGIASIGKWTEVVVNVLKHSNKSLLAATDPFLATARDHYVRHVEFVSDPLGRGGYKSIEAVVDDYIAFGTAIRTAFPAVDGTEVFRLVAPSFKLTTEADAASTIGAFLAGLDAKGKLDLVNVVGFETKAASPLANQAIAKAVRAIVDVRAPGRLVWLARYEPSTDAVTPPPVGLVQDLVRRTWSLEVGVFSAATRIALQGLVDGAAFWRADRRYLTVDPNPDRTEESPFWRRNGTALPAALQSQALSLVAGSGRVRLDVGAPPESDKDTLWTLATLEKDHPCPNGGLCPRIHLAVVNSDTSALSTRVDYQVALSGVSAVGSDERVVTIHHLSLGANVESAVAPQELNSDWVAASVLPETVPLVAGSISYRFTAPVPSMEYVLIELGEAPSGGGVTVP